jgi:uncharacterized protein YajQ (UPF0234 family)
MADASFDVVSQFDQQELVNALDQVRREIGTRYDLKGSNTTLELGKDEITLQTADEYHANAVKDLLQSKAVRRGLSLKIFDWGRLEPAAGSSVRQHIGLKRGLTTEQAKELSKKIRDEFPKVKPSVQGDAVRVSGKSKDELQAVIGFLRGLDYPAELQFENYRGRAWIDRFRRVRRRATQSSSPRQRVSARHSAHAAGTSRPPNRARAG